MIKLKDIILEIESLSELTAADIHNNYEGPTAQKYNISAIFKDFNPKTNILTFKVWDSFGSGSYHIVKIQMLDYNSIKSSDDTVENKLTKTLKDGNLRVYCSCGSYIYNGFAYTSYILGGGLKKVTRKPMIRNPKELGIACKHIKGLLQKIHVYIPIIAKKIKQI